MAPLVYVLVLLYQTVSTDAECTVIGCNSTFCEGDKCTECVKPFYLTLVGSCGHCYLQCRLCDSNICFSCPPPTVSCCDYACEIADCPISCTGPGNTCPDCPDGFFKYNPNRQECFRCYYSGCKCSTFQGCIDCLPGRYDTTSNCKHTCPSECITCTNTSNCTECIPGKYGPACASDCKSQCQDGSCDKDSGVCPSGCLADQFLDSNQKCKACPDRCGSCTNYSYCISCSSLQYWGPVCERDCAGCINNCSKDIGCLSECSTKYYHEFNKNLNGYICSRCPESCRSCNNASRCSVCETGYWGNTCQHNCSGCKASCIFNDGCSSGCLSGYYERVINGGIQCEKCPDNCVSCTDNATCKECISGYYSPDAANCIICSDKCLGGNCITHNGICTNGCVNGWTGHQCNQECPPGCLQCEQLTAAHCSLCKIGFYGNSCENICSVHCNLNDGNQTCNQIDGACINGCLSGYWGRNCNRPCGPGCYGTQCNETTGACYSGCKDNFSGNHCDKECISVQDVKTDLHTRDETDEIALDALQREVKDSMRAAFSSGTSRNLRAQWKAYFLFCNFYGVKAIPTTVNTLCLFAQFLGRSFKSVESIKNYVSGVKTLHQVLDVKYPQENLYQLNLVFRGLNRKSPHMPNRALPITPQILKDMSNHLDVSKPIDATFWCLFLFMFFLMARKSNMVPVSYADFDPEKQLLRHEIKVFDYMLVVLIKWSKTNQFGSRLLKVPLAAIPDSRLCPVNAFKHMVRLTPGAGCEPAFCIKPRKGSLQPLLYSQLQERIKSLIAKTGRDPSLYSSHSFRRGGCTWAFKAGVPTSLIQHHGDWLSECYKRYLAFDFHEKLSVSESMAVKIMESNLHDPLSPPS